MISPLADLIRSLPQQPQTQRVLNEQLEDLRQIAVKVGLYDASDFIRDVLERSRR